MSEQIAILIQIILIDLVLAADNAIIIGMLASKFETNIIKKNIFLGYYCCCCFKNNFYVINCVSFANKWTKISWRISFIVGCL